MSDIEPALIADTVRGERGIMCGRLVADALQAVLDAVRASRDEREYYMEIAQEAVDLVARAFSADDGPVPCNDRTHDGRIIGPCEGAE